jgi:DinB superfamily
MSTLRIASEQIALARRYTEQLLDGIDMAEWFRMPAEGITHVAWQVGHLAAAEYFLVLQRVRGVRPEDDELIAPAFREAFGRTSRPNGDPSRNPAPEEIRAIFDRVHAQVMRDLPNLPEADLTTVLDRPHRVAKTKGDSLFWCASHEMLHAGHIGLLRRLLGRPPLW